MNLQPLAPVMARSCAASLKIRCCRCGQQATYMQALERPKWWADLDGAAFHDWYCEPCSWAVALRAD